MTHDMQTIIIRNIAEETQCNYCGRPLYTGDHATVHGGDVYCQSICAQDNDELVCTVTIQAADWQQAMRPEGKAK
jgi:hypothetical protein